MQRYGKLKQLLQKNTGFKYLEKKVRIVRSFIHTVQISVKKKLFWYWGFKIFRIIAFCIGMLFFVRTFSYHSAIINLNAPQDYREDKQVLFTQRILDNKPIFTASSMPAYTQDYGMLYNYVVAAIAKFSGSSYVLHRIVSALFMFLCFAWLYKIARKIGGDWLTSFLGILILYHYAAFSQVENGPRPDSMGLFLFFVTVFVPWFLNFSYLSLIASIVASIMAFYTKPYFVLGVVYVGAYLLVCRHIKKAFVFAVSWIILFGLVALWVNWKYDFYFFNTLIIPNNYISNLGWHLQLQTKDFIVRDFALFITSFIAVSATLTAFIQRKKNIAHYPPAYFIICLLVSWIIIIGRMGGNAGAYLTYYNQLITPFMILIAVAYWRNNRSIVLVAFLVVSIFVLLIKTNFTVDVQAINKNRKEWEQYLNTYTSIFPLPSFSYYVYTRGMPVYDAGDAEYFPQGIPKNGSRQSNIADKIYKESIKDFEKKVNNKEFDILTYLVPYTNGVNNLMYSGYVRDLVKTRYRYAGIKKWITAYRNDEIEIWVR
ncbi:hypothetical protein A2973_00605 [Candidatus Gottesmanbacteria bacterium RIFCSPLOWO2_01_FULL_49_10]|uniref:Glycosyltransferase RgtA/B/C/D-like domain-containing protein n=1 Tax=Candidatus Gottesmanbacteria bacterium RIFCSPLOWO2_01_FULL_49_10 TaxID=1798396 RepID=A0A1F6AWT8_9BACT|nr:MAG: hypothetical protein UY10_C0002G0021 [Microgenomates group bacterium GW2011_GWA2_47_8]OGG29088.1 MAG: hypothetical protein A2973_00605 [Candidatus Gottesmanbacteria bacterium RIFCSPLOWO2_01_FULL_49_10]